MPRRQGRTQRQRRQDIIQQIVQGLAEDVREEEPDTLPEKFVFERWKANSGEYQTVCKLFSTDKSEHVCAIMHEPTCSASVDNLPELWPLENAEGEVGAGANTVQLQCSHIFYAPALAFHFLVKDMRCPVCRQGCLEQMHLLSVPLSVRHLYEAKVQALVQNTLHDEIASVDPMQIASVLSDLEVEMRIFPPSANTPNDHTPWASHTASARTRVIFEAEHVEHIQQRVLGNNTDAPLTTNFAVHRSFQRLIRSIIGRHYFLNTGCRVRFALTHPLIPLRFRSNEMAIGHTWLTHFTSPDSSTIPLFCPNVAGTEPVGFIRCAFCPTTLTTSITVDMNMYIIINIVTNVSDIIDSIRDTVQQHMSVQLPVVALLHNDSQ